MAIGTLLIEPASASTLPLLVLLALAFHAAAGNALIEGGVNNGLEDLDGFVAVLSAESLEPVPDVAVPRAASLTSALPLLMLTITIAIAVPVPFS
jgi:hypothetical protein